MRRWTGNSFWMVVSVNKVSKFCLPTSLINSYHFRLLSALIKSWSSLWKVSVGLDRILLTISSLRGSGMSQSIAFNFVGISMDIDVGFCKDTNYIGKDFAACPEHRGIRTDFIWTRSIWTGFLIWTGILIWTQILFWTRMTRMLRILTDFFDHGIVFEQGS